ncbi:hypothetical protein BHE74_00043289 [Ensete ventricosum]|nr:hypothetical protein GW17_00018697 [Ensete ventricosum]RWW50443.1 hypothetical protein BHE74_00043289 [Ensete ventricosum]RZR78082.1 hypothetical protein BHM03_00003329 [Ensete ventricosum]
MRKEISQYIQTGQEAIARIRVEYIIREQNILAAYEIIELFCEFILARVPILESQRDCPLELQEAIASIIFASPRCSDLPELLHIRNLFSTKYGKEFVAAASELRPESNVNRMIIEKLTARAPLAELKIKVLKEIAQEYNLVWDSSSTEAELSKNHEDLLDGLNPTNSQATVTASFTGTSQKDGPPVSPVRENRTEQLPRTSIPSVNNLSSLASKISVSDDGKADAVRSQTEVLSIDKTSCSSQSSSDVLDKARAAIASADRASAAARAAAELVKVKLPRQSNNFSHGN